MVELHKKREPAARRVDVASDVVTDDVVEDERVVEVPAARGRKPVALRVSTQDRLEVVGVLEEALALGYLDLSEFEERSEKALDARSADDLVVLTEDVAGVKDSREARVRKRTKAEKAHREARESLLTFLSVLVVLVTVWGASSVASGELAYFWPLWVLLGWGVPAVATFAATKKKLKE